MVKIEIRSDVQHGPWKEPWLILLRSDCNVIVDALQYPRIAPPLF